MTTDIERSYCDFIRQNMSRDMIQKNLESAGFAVYDKESSEELTQALAEHCRTEKIAPQDLLAE